MTANMEFCDCVNVAVCSLIRRRVAVNRRSPDILPTTSSNHLGVTECSAYIATMRRPLEHLSLANDS